jgi:hypothetical protein
VLETDVASQVVLDELDHSLQAMSCRPGSWRRATDGLRSV